MTVSSPENHSLARRRLSGQLIGNSGNERARGPAVASHGRKLLEDLAIERDLWSLDEVQPRGKGLDLYAFVVTQPKAVPWTDNVLSVSANDPKANVCQSRQRDEPIELGEHGLRSAQTQAQGRFRDDEMEALVL